MPRLRKWYLRRWDWGCMTGKSRNARSSWRVLMMFPRTSQGILISQHEGMVRSFCCVLLLHGPKWQTANRNVWKSVFPWPWNKEQHNHQERCAQEINKLDSHWNRDPKSADVAISEGGDMVNSGRKNKTKLLRRTVLQIVLTKDVYHLGGRNNLKVLWQQNNKLWLSMLYVTHIRNWFYVTSSIWKSMGLDRRTFLFRWCRAFFCVSWDCQTESNH